MNKVSITLDVSKITRNKIVDRRYTNRNNQQVLAKEYKVELIALKEPKLVSEGDTWKMVKTHFVVETQTKDERAAKVPAIYVGEGFSFEEKKPEVSALDTMFPDGENVDYPEENINLEDIPF